jgi:hypothetical protein
MLRLHQPGFPGVASCRTPDVGAMFPHVPEVSDECTIGTMHCRVIEMNAYRDAKQIDRLNHHLRDWSDHALKN